MLGERDKMESGILSGPRFFDTYPFGVLFVVVERSFHVIFLTFERAAFAAHLYVQARLDLGGCPQASSLLSHNDALSEISPLKWTSSHGVPLVVPSRRSTSKLTGLCWRPFPLK